MNSTAGFAVELVFSQIYSSHGIFGQEFEWRRMGMVGLIQHYVVPCVKRVEWGSGTKGLRMVAVFCAGIHRSFKPRLKLRISWAGDVICARQLLVAAAEETRTVK